MGFVRLVVEQDRSGSPLKLDELLILWSLLGLRRLNLADASRLIQKPESDAESAFERLIRLGWADRTKQRDLFAPSVTSLAYVVVRKARKGRFGLTEEEIERRILDWVHINKSINSREAADKYGVTQREARYILSKMLKSGRLRSQGQRRWKRYISPWSVYGQF
jgi:hypothetical protein